MVRKNKLLIFILTLGVFGILNTEIGVVGILPSLADHYNISISQAGLLVGLFAFTVAIVGPILPLLLSGFDRKKVMILALCSFILGNTIIIFTTDFYVALIGRIIPALFHPVYFSLAFTVAAASVKEEDVPKAISKIFIGVSAGMVLGVPVASFLDSVTSFEITMASFAVVNIIVLIATLIFVPSMPVEKRLSYGVQIAILKKANTWLSLITVILINCAIIGIYSYLAEFLKTVTKAAPNIVTLLLFVYGGANIIGNIMAGNLLTKNARKLAMFFPLILSGVYLLLILLGQFTIPMAILTLLLGVLGGIGGNLNQFWIMSAAPEAPDFSNGLYITAMNIGTTAGSFMGGIIIAEMGIKYIFGVGILSLLLSLITTLLRIFPFTPKTSEAM